MVVFYWHRAGINIGFPYEIRGRVLRTQGLGPDIMVNTECCTKGSSSLLVQGGLSLD